jgi:hypothetical protein
MKDDKNQIIRSMKSYEVGGATDDMCMETVMVDGKPKRRRRKSGCGKVTKYGQRSIPEGVKKALGTVAMGVAGALAYKNRDAIKEKLGMKKGGTVKRKMQSGGTASSTFADSERRMASPVSKSATMKKGGTIKRKR